MNSSKPMVDPDKPEKVVTVKSPWWDGEAYPEFTLKPRQFGRDDWEVFLPDGTWLGTVGRYTGSIDTKIAGTRLRHEGVRRTLWSYLRPGSRYTMFEQESRAECLRRLYREHERSMR